MKRRVVSRGIPRDFRVNDLSRSDYVLAVVACVLIAVSIWSYWPTIGSLWRAWLTQQDYSVGQLVPLVALFLVWRERRELRACSLAPCWSLGIPLLVFAQAICLYGLLRFSFSMERYSLVLAVAALILIVLGWQVFRRLLWIVLFLFLMFPLPGRIHSTIADPLQGLATTGSVFLLEAIRIRVGQQGNIVMLNDSIPLAVAEACSGLRMLTAFVIVSAFVAYMVKRPRWQKATLLMSSIPIAVAANMIRIFLTALVMLYVSVDVGEKFFHDFAGLVMMPAAVGLIFGLLWLMDRMVVEEGDSERSHVITRTKGPDRAARGGGGSGMARPKARPVPK